MKTLNHFLSCIALLALLVSCGKTEGQWKLVWEEDFAGETIDESVWTRVDKGGADWNDMMSLREDLAFVENGQLVLLGKIGESGDATPFVTGGVKSSGKKSFRGPVRMEIKARFNCVNGFWPALWLLPDTPFAPGDYAEIDIMEHLNSDDFAYQTVHSRFTRNGAVEPPKYATFEIDREGWNVYATEIHRDSICMFINGVKTLTYPRVEGLELQFPWFDYPYFFILSNQLGGGWVGPVDNPGQLPSELRVDWIRVYESTCPEEPAAEGQDLLSGDDLSGWKVVLKEDEPAEGPTFSLSDGILQISGQPFGYIRTEEKFSDYVLQLEWRWAGSEGVDGGIFNYLQEGDKVWPQGVQLQMTPKDMGVLMGGIPLEGVEGPFYRKPRIVEESPEKPVGEWNRMVFFCKDGHISAWLNGVLVNLAVSEATEGYIGFQSEGGPMEFRNVIIYKK